MAASLEELCLSVLGEYADRLDPSIFSGIPRHLLMEIAKRLNPFDLQRLENSKVFELSGISTDTLWKERYLQRWHRVGRSPRRADYKKINDLKEECAEECDSWRAAYLQRHLQVLINERQSVTEVSQHNLREVYLSPLLNRVAYQRIWSLENTLNHCSRHATLLKLSNRGCMYLAENQNIFLRFAEYIKFLRVYCLQSSGVDALCLLLKTLATKNLFAVGFCDHGSLDLQSWNKIFSTRSSACNWKQCKGQLITDDCTIPVKSRSSVCSESCSSTSYQDFQASDTADTLSPTASQINPQAEIDLTFTINGHKSDSPITFSSVGDTDSFHTRDEQLHVDSDNLDIYDFDADGEMPAHIPLQMKTTESLSDDQSDSDLYNEVFAGTSGTVRTNSISSLNVWTPVRENKLHMYGIPTMETLPASSSYFPQDASTAFSHLQHLEFKPLNYATGDLFALLARVLESCHNLESLLILFGHSCGDYGGLVGAMLKLCLRGRLKSLELGNLLPTCGAVVGDGLVEVLSQVVGAHCTVCQPNAAASLKCLRLIDYANISAKGAGVLAEKLVDVCSCQNKRDNDSNTQEAYSAQSNKVHGDPHGEPPMHVYLENGVASSNSEKWRGSLLRVTNDKQSTPEDFTGKNVEGSDRLTHLGQRLEPETISRFTGLQELQLSFSCIRDEGAIVIAASLETNSTLVCLSLPSCGLHTPGMSAIFRALSGNRTLKSLHLSGNSYSPVSDSSLANTLKTSQRLSQLDISHCFGPHEGLTKEVVSALCQNSSLRCLKLSGNRLGDSGMEMLANVFSKPNTLSCITRLELSSNHITPHSVAVLVTALHALKPRKLKEIVLADNEFGPDINRVRANLQSVVESVYVRNQNNALACADYVSQM